MDACDYAQERTDLVLKKQIEVARKCGHQLPGPNMCGCGEVNDRQLSGFNTCSDCYRYQRAVMAGGHGS